MGLWSPQCGQTQNKVGVALVRGAMWEGVSCSGTSCGSRMTASCVRAWGEFWRTGATAGGATARRSTTPPGTAPERRMGGEDGGGETSGVRWMVKINCRSHFLFVV